MQQTNETLHKILFTSLLLLGFELSNLSLLAEPGLSHIYAYVWNYEKINGKRK